MAPCSLRARGNEGGEEAVELARAMEAFWMPLHGDTECRPGAFHTFDDAVGRPGRDHQSVTEDGHRLVMPAVHHDGTGVPGRPQDAIETRTRRDVYRVRQRRRRRAAVVDTR